MLIVAIALLTTMLTAWEWRMRSLELLPGDLDDGPSSWAALRRRIDTENVPLAIVGDSRILFDTDLDRFEMLTGVRPLQLALPGTNGCPFLQNIAADPHFRGLLIVGITDVSYFRKETGRMAGALEAYRYESPAQRVSRTILDGLSRVFGFLDDDYRLSKLVQRLDPDWRSGVLGPYDDAWKLRVTGADRQTWLWPRIQSDTRLREHARMAWRFGSFAGAPVSDEIVAATLSATQAAVAAIRAHGGDVVFVHPPSAPELRAREDARLPRSRGWDSLLTTAGVRGIHADDEPTMHGLDIPEFSHLSRACATVFTDSYVRRLAQISDQVHLLRTAPPPLAPADCTVP